MNSTDSALHHHNDTVDTVELLLNVEIIMQHLLTGASPGHSYTVKSPSSFSSSVEAAESGTLGSTLCLRRTHKYSARITARQDRDTHARVGWTCLCREGDSLSQGEHLLLLVLVVVHLGTVGQLLVPKLEVNKGWRGDEKVPSWTSNHHSSGHARKSLKPEELDSNQTLTWFTPTGYRS